MLETLLFLFVVFFVIADLIGFYALGKARGREEERRKMKEEMCKQIYIALEKSSAW